MTINAQTKDSQAPERESAELAAFRAILQNLLLEVARETGAERLAVIRHGALGALSATTAGREQSAAIVQATFDMVAAEAGFSEARNLH